MTPQQATLYEAVGNLIKAKGRFHTEQNYAALVVAFDAETASRRAPAPTSEPGARDAGEIPLVTRLRIFAGCAMDDMQRLHEAFGFPEAQSINADDMIEAIAELQSAALKESGLATPASPAEHVAEVGSTYQLVWAGSGPIAPIVEKHGLKVGSKLYAHPAANPAPLVAQASPELLPRRRFVHVTGFLDADYVEFLAGSNYGGGVFNGVPCESLHYTRSEAEGNVAHGVWREVAAPEASPLVEDAQLSGNSGELVEDAQRIVAGKVEGCGCRKCNPEMVGQWFFLCSICGNKRCPHANDHRNECTDSNEPGQKGSAYESQGRATTGNATADDGKDK